MTITVPPETTVGNIIDGEERPCVGETLEKLAPGCFVAGEAELPRVLEAVA